ncbi:hypothetical protein BACCIP111895_03982 [Neobacillus rhizosphaerae]|uniref:RNase H type-1 domain-containing protein n=1 Tax=Neobacillus rhizosphaerae TaxID=2880965 RepID=A0ABN8KVZ3_9BACI|nr:reverse transcriptase-like protein [Neobacillus rhizosphaerae]CAH2716794.1 hypothetical protein BACCIP111895_03982 [Neobacillus rhizosphaerae]
MGKIKATKAQMNAYLEDGMPHYLIGNEYRFLEGEVLKWLESYQPSQERLEREFVDKKGRTLKEYVSEDIVLTTLRITKEIYISQCKKGLPFERVGEKIFFNMQDILKYYRRGSKTTTKGMSSTGGQKKKFLMHVCKDVPKEVPIMIVDGSYNFDNSTAGTGLLLVENRDTVTGVSNVRKIKTTKPIVCELLALLDALRMMKKKKLNKAIIVTDQESWTKGITIDPNIYEGPVKNYLIEFNLLWTEMKGKVVVKFVGELNKGKKNLLYKKAHTLSREYKTGLFKQLEIE